MPEGLWRTLAVALLTLTIGALGSWWNLGADLVTKAEVHAIVQAEAPSSSDFKALSAEIVKLQIEQARTSEKLDLLLRKSGVK